MPDDAPIITVDNLTLAYGSFVVMQDLTFEIRRGEIFAIMGGSGSGKSTLLKHLIGLQTADTGRIQFAGREMNGSEEALQDMRRAFSTSTEPCGAP